MTNQESLWDKIVKHFYGISGNFDEYKRQEVNRIGNNAFMISWPTLLIAPAIACFWAESSPENALLGLILTNFFYFTLVVLPYIAWASRHAGLTTHEISYQDRHVAYRHIFWVSVGQALYFFILESLVIALTDTVFDGTNFWHDLGSMHQFTKTGLTSILFGAAMGLVSVSRLKKY
ncbi:DUF3278 domain-containing protein [Levilactobacillus brevis]|uniref:DUF3278 domain-containing protein n=1 Tax=Levilactobacillus brevis TaxID=1580 RepID=UPI003D179B02